ncbi:UNVERIFIED_CONTAM: hypothetical protein C7383_103197 [Murimonas intestini]|uniref:Uncharacterized protein n=1 Tax=Murimonas intestini TaxID=1337051 RepID=A0AB73T6L5_9FIRM
MAVTIAMAATLGLLANGTAMVGFGLTVLRKKAMAVEK